MDYRIFVLKKTIIKNLELPLTIEELRAEVNLSASHLRRLFKEETKMSFGEFVREQRLERARELLATTLMRAKEVGAAVGIYDQAYFNRLFKNKYGLTPRKYHEENYVKFKSIGDASGK